MLLREWSRIKAAAGVRGFQAWAPSPAVCGTPLWWKQGRPRRVHGSLPEVQLLSHLAVLLKPEVPMAELFRDFPTERSAAWGANVLSPDLALYGVLKPKAAGLFLEYDGHYRHHDAIGLEADERKTEALLGFAPPGSVVLRIAHSHRGLKARQNSMEIVVDRWKSWRQEDVLVPLQQVVDAVLEELNRALHTPLRRQLKDFKVHTSGLCFKEAGNFVADAQLRGDRELRHVRLHVFLEKLGLSPAQVAKVVAGFPSILGLSIEANLKPKVEWLRDLGLSQAQVAKVVAVLPQVLGYSIEANLNLTVEWLRDLGLSQEQVAKIVSCFPQVLGLSIEANLNAKRAVLQHFYTQTELCEIVAVFPQLLGYSLRRLQRRLPAMQKIDRLSLVKSWMARTDSCFGSCVLRHSSTL